MGGSGSKTGVVQEASGRGADLASPNHDGMSSAHSVIPAWSAGKATLSAPTIAPRRARKGLAQNTLKVPAPRPDPLTGVLPSPARGGYEKSDVVVMASPAAGPGADPSPKLGQLKGMLQNGLIEQQDYDERKRQLLDGMILEEFDDVLAIADRALSSATGALSLGAPLSPAAAEGQGVEPSVLLKTSRARLLVKPLDEDLDPWDRQRWWESDVGREARLLKLSAGTDTFSWHAISSGEKLGEVSLRDCTLRRTTSRPRGQGAPGFVLTSRAGFEGEVPLAGSGHRTECHVRMLPEDLDGGEASEQAEFEDWMDALAPFLPRAAVGVSLRFLQRFLFEHPEVVSASMSSAKVYEQVISEGLLTTESHVERMLRDSTAAQKQPHDLGPTTVFVSHAHDSSFGELVATLAQTELRAVKAEQQSFRAYYWLDLFCQSAASPGQAAKARTDQAKERGAIRRAFEEADMTRAGALSMGGFASALKKVGVHHPHDVLRELMASLDVNGNGTIELPEFEAVVQEYRKTHPVAPLISSTGNPLIAAGKPGEEYESRRRCIEAAWHPSGVPKIVMLMCEWPNPKALKRLGCWHEVMLGIEVGADTEFELSPAARAGFIGQVKSGELSFTLDQRPRWNRPRPGEYSSGPVAQAIDMRTVAAHAKAGAADRERKESSVGAQKTEHWVVGPKADEVDWILHAVDKLPTLTTRGQGGRWVTRGVERLNMAVRNAVEEELFSLYQDSVFTGPVVVRGGSGAGDADA